MKNNIKNIASDLGIESEALTKAIENNKTISKTKYIALGKSNIMTISGFKHLLPLYRDAMNAINEKENKRVFEQIAAREGIQMYNEFRERMNNDAEYRTEILRKYKIG